MNRYFLSFLLLNIISFTAHSQAPVISPISGPSVVCSFPGTPSSYTATASNAPTSYFWSVSPSAGVNITYSGPGSPNISFPNTSTSYTITASAINGSGTSNTSTFAVTVMETPQVTFSGNNIYCQGSPTSIQAYPNTVAASSTISYTWTPAAGLSSQFVSSPIASPAATTSYSVLFAIGSCTNASQVTVSVSTTPTLNVVPSKTLMCESESNTLTITGNAISYSINGTPVSPVEVIPPFAIPPAMYLLFVTGSNGSCIGSTTTSFSIAPSPTLNVLSVPAMCQAVPASVLINGNATSYSLNSIPCSAGLAQLPSNLPTGPHTFTVTGVIGACTNSSTGMIYVNPSPTVSATLNRTLMCTGETNTITITGNAATYSVNLVPSGMQVPISNTITAGAHMYMVVGTNASSCTAFSALSLSVSACTGIQGTLQDDETFTIFPNPANGEFYVKATGPAVNEIIIYDGIGRTVKKIITNGTSEITVSDLKPGVYYITAGTRRQKLIVSN